MRGAYPFWQSGGAEPQRTRRCSPGAIATWHSWFTASERSTCSFVTESPSPSCSCCLRAGRPPTPALQLAASAL